MKHILKLNEKLHICKYINEGSSCSKNNNCTFPNCGISLKLIKINDEFVIINAKERILSTDWVFDWFNNQIKKYSDIGTGVKIIFATPSLNLEGVPEIKEKWVEEWEKVNNQIKEGVNPHAYRLGYKQAKQKLFTEEDLLSIVNEIGFIKTSSKELNSKDYQPFITDEDGEIWTINKEHLLNLIQSIKQPKVEITFENGVPVKTVML